MCAWRCLALAVACFLVACADETSVRACIRGESGNLQCQSRLGDAPARLGKVVAVCGFYDSEEPDPAMCKFAICVEPSGCVSHQGVCRNQLPSRG